VSEPFFYLSINYSHRFVLLGDFDPGVQPRGTPISAEVVRGGDVDITVMWRGADGRAASSSWSKSSGWDLPNRPNDGNKPLNAPEKYVYIAFYDVISPTPDSPSDSLPGFIASVDHPLTTVSWKQGKEVSNTYCTSKRVVSNIPRYEYTTSILREYSRNTPTPKRLLVLWKFIRIEDCPLSPVRYHGYSAQR
jgi:hypothetical protein